jgi:nucleoside-diphosphate-sugar epimerase
MRIVVTGGFVGGAVCLLLRDRGHEVVGLRNRDQEQGLRETLAAA